MKVCTFFGHRDAKQEIVPILKSTILHSIEKEQVDIFYLLVNKKVAFGN